MSAKNDDQNNNDLDSQTDNSQNEVWFEETDSGESADVDLSKKLNKLKTELKQCKAKESEYLLGWQRSRADFVNLKKSFEKEREYIVKYSNAGLLEELLIILDSFETAFSNKELWETVAEEWRKGIENMYNQMMAVVSKHGLFEIEAIGKEFDASLHQAVGTEKVSNQSQESEVLRVVQKGYTLNGKVLRPAMVVIGEMI